MIFAFGIITFLYIFLILFLLFEFNKIKEFISEDCIEKSTFSIVIPFRNEVENLPKLLKSLSYLAYPKDLFEIILVNDASEDESEEICSKFISAHPKMAFSLINSERKTSSPKKDALNTAILISKNQFIVTTDADCEVPEKWLNQFNEFLQKNPVKMIAGPVKATSSSPKAGGKNSFLKIFQELDFLSLQSATMGGFGIGKAFLCNGANLCYEKESFLNVNGFEGNENFAGGDDVFLLQKFKNARLKTAFLKSKRAVVSTSAQKNIRTLFSQRIRWAGKTSAVGGIGKWVGIIVFLMNFGLVIGSLFALFGSFPQKFLLFFFVLKFNVDFIFIYKSAEFFGMEKSMKNYIWCSFLYPFFSSAVVFLSFFSGFQWKGRHFRK